MEQQDFMKKYARNFEYIERLSTFPLHYTPTFDELELTRAALQACYRDIKEIDFEGGVIDYVCYLSTEFILREWKKLEDMGLGDDLLLKVLLGNQENGKNLVRLFCKDMRYFMKNRSYNDYLTVNDYRFMIENDLTAEEFGKLKNTDS